jgi:hypothetical protein
MEGAESDRKTGCKMAWIAQRYDAEGGGASAKGSGAASRARPADAREASYGGRSVRAFEAARGQSGAEQGVGRAVGAGSVNGTAER